MEEITLLLEAAHRGEQGADERLMRAVYDELRHLAAQKLAREHAAYALEPTLLVHEAWLRLGGDQQPAWQNRAHFFGAAAEAMRRILVDEARHRNALRNGANLRRVTLDNSMDLPGPAVDERVAAVSDALDRFAEIDPEAARLVTLHYFGGFTVGEAARILGISKSTAARWWNFARAWLFRELKKEWEI